MAIEFDSVLSDEDLENIKTQIIDWDEVTMLDILIDAYYNLREQLKREGED